MAARRVGFESESAAERLADPTPEAAERHPTGGAHGGAQGVRSGYIPPVFAH
jgi:hypothetical protein